MTKSEFITELRKRLSGLPAEDIEERIAFYSEMIDDMIEEGRTEKEALLDIGSVEEISSQIISDIPLKRIAKERIKPKRRIQAWEIILLVLGSPIWFSLAVASVSVILSLYVVLWSVVISFWAVFASLIAGGIGVIVGGAVIAVIGSSISGIALIGSGLVCVGISLFVFIGCSAITKCTVILTKKIALGIKKCFIRKEK